MKSCAPTSRILCVCVAVMLCGSLSFAQPRDLSSVKPLFQHVACAILSAARGDTEQAEAHLVVANEFAVAAVKELSGCPLGTPAKLSQSDGSISSYTDWFVTDPAMGRSAEFCLGAVYQKTKSDLFQSILASPTQYFEFENWIEERDDMIVSEFTAYGCEDLPVGR